MDAMLNDELDKFVTHIKEESNNAPGNIIHVHDMFGLTMINVLWRLVSGKSYDYNDEKMTRLLHLNDEFFQSTNFGLDVTNVFPVLRDWFPKWAGTDIQRRAGEALNEYGRTLINEHKKHLAAQNQPECFIDVFAQKVLQNENDPKSDFTG